MSSEAISYFPEGVSGLADTELRQTEALAQPCEAIDAKSCPISLSSDERLLEAVGNGDRQALSILFQRHARSVFHVAWRILRSESEAYDVRQDVFLYLFERAQLFDSRKGSAISWIMQITYHRAFNKRKFLSRHHGDSLDVFEEYGKGAGASLPSTDILDGKIILERLKGQLTTPQRQTLELHLFDGYSLREIADQTGQTVVNVRHHYYRALDRLRANLFSKK